ncbi:sulfite exporter TauE/SafE family protein [Xanthomonas sp. XNM01]|uniref:sulfite exporter TauE/SafE family protein n=1 Tax=Xanthomonas sp. XNM01 TaxID=2769289 RepID=UPI00177D37FF|nr:sulfite exporter TauE/SafE family protein [Xanthomonas sp. XNM01]MBD9370193.1 sulfite exporter TauE/SafE family protein [Xanthomonas sp. XNM01]
MPIDVPMLVAAALAGLLGGVHCAAMCGGIATGFSAMSRGGGLAVALQANLGRVGGYVLAGALVGGFGGGLLQLARLETLALGLRMATGLVLVLVALRLLDRSGRLNVLGKPGTRAWRWLQPLQRRLLPADTAWRRLALGALWGWLPCGLSVSLLTAAWLQASARDGALTMAAFGLGTLPVMLPLTWSGARMGRWLQRPALRTALACVVLAAGLLTLSSPWLMRIPALHGPLAALGCMPA